MFILFSVLFVGLTALVCWLSVLGAKLSLSLDKETGGVIFYPGFKRYGQKMALLIKDMKDNPGTYLVDKYTLKNGVVCLWIASGWEFVKDYEDWTDKASSRLGPISLFDRLAFWKAFEELRGNGKTANYTAPVVTDPLSFELALRRKNGGMS